MIFKTDLRLNDTTFKKLPTLIGMHITALSSEFCVAQTDGKMSLGNLQLECTDKLQKTFLNIGPYFQYHELHGDDVCSMNVRINDEINPKYQSLADRKMNYSYQFDNGVAIRKIEVFGQHRTRTWSKHFIHGQKIITGLSPDEVHTDELFTIEVVRLICEGLDQCIYLRSFRNWIDVEISDSMPEYFDWFYPKEELDMDFEFHGETDFDSKEKVYKKHYVIE